VVRMSEAKLAELRPGEWGDRVEVIGALRNLLRRTDDQAYNISLDFATHDWAEIVRGLDRGRKLTTEDVADLRIRLAHANEQAAFLKYLTTLSEAAVGVRK